jgi:flagellar protein FliS
MYQKGCSAYRQSAANTVENKQVILLKLYEGALVFNSIAKRGIRNNSPRIRGENISKIMAIINELECALDHERGGEISTRLSSLYKYIMDRLLYASNHNDIEALEQVEKVMLVLKDGFEEAMKSQQKPAVMPSNVMPEMSSSPQSQKAVQCAV